MQLFETGVKKGFDSILCYLKVSQSKRSLDSSATSYQPEKRICFEHQFSSTSFHSHVTCISTTTPAPFTKQAPMISNPASVISTPAPFISTPAPLTYTPAPLTYTPATFVSIPAPFISTPAPLTSTRTVSISPSIARTQPIISSTTVLSKLVKSFVLFSYYYFLFRISYRHTI